MLYFDKCLKLYSKLAKSTKKYFPRYKLYMSVTLMVDPIKFSVVFLHYLLSISKLWLFSNSTEVHI